MTVAPTIAKPGPLREARAEHLRKYLASQGSGLLLDERTFEVLRERGLVRRDVEQALDDLVAAGEIELSASSVCVRVLARPGPQAA